MSQSKETSDPNAERLLALNVRLTQSLFEAGIVRIRLLKAREANVWPTLHSTVRPFSVNDEPDPNY